MWKMSFLGNLRPSTAMMVMGVTPGRLRAGSPTAITHEKKGFHDLNQTSMRTCSMLIFRGVVDRISKPEITQDTTFD